jgi:hypothetical protein
VIVYNLRCKNGHEFEGWFRDSAAFDLQSEDGKLFCPTCNSRRVEKAIMAPALAGSRDREAKRSEARNMRQFMTGLRKYVQEHAEYVGSNFAEEARKIHYGESVDRHIYGETTAEEAKDLVDEGLDVAPLPPDMDGAN